MDTGSSDGNGSKVVHTGPGLTPPCPILFLCRGGSLLASCSLGIPSFNPRVLKNFPLAEGEAQRENLRQQCLEAFSFFQGTDSPPDAKRCSLMDRELVQMPGSVGS